MKQKIFFSLLTLWTFFSLAETDPAINDALKDTQDLLKDKSNIKFLPLQPFERLGQLLGLADIHLLPQSPEAADLVLPSKLSGMLASGKAVISTCKADTELANVVAHCGLVVAPEDGNALADAIGKLVDDDKARKTVGAAR